MHQTVKKLVLVSTTSALITRIKRKDKILVKILYIYYSIWFQKNINNIKALRNLSNKVNVITPAYLLNLRFCICYSNMDIKKLIDLFSQYLGQFWRGFKYKKSKKSFDSFKKLF